MGTTISRFLARAMALAFLASLSLMVAACFGIGDAPASSTQLSTSTQSSTPTQPSTSGTMVTVTISEKVGGHDIYSFDPQNITIKAGTPVKWVNNSDENHLFTSDTSGVFTSSSMVPRNGSTDNTYQMVFSTPGTYHYSSTLVKRANNQPEGVSSSATGTITVTA
jgi:plastocyanin